jgi:hypothetical protein
MCMFKRSPPFLVTASWIYIMYILFPVLDIISLVPESPPKTYTGTVTANAIPPAATNPDLSCISSTSTSVIPC